MENASEHSKSFESATEFEPLQLACPAAVSCLSEISQEMLYSSPEYFTFSFFLSLSIGLCVLAWKHPSHGEMFLLYIVLKTMGFPELKCLSNKS